MSALLFCGTVLLFSRAMRCDFVNYDDPAYITDNPQVQGGMSWAGVVWAFTTPADYWHPLTWLSHMLDWELYGSSASGHHLTSVLWHALNAVLAFLVFRRLIGGLWLGAFFAALFAWHPLRVESVVWVTERKDVLSGCFFLLTVLAYVRYVDLRKSGRPWGLSYSLMLASFAAGLMCKPMLVTLPLVLLILDWWPLQRAGRATSRMLQVPGDKSSTRAADDIPSLPQTPPLPFAGLVLEKVPLFLLSIVASVVTVLMQHQHGAFVLDLSLAARAGNAVVSLARYLGKFFWPTDLIVCYPHPGSWPVSAILAATALVLGIASLAWQQRRARPWIASGGLWYLIVLLPVIGLVQVGFQAMADRYTYLPLLGIELALLGTAVSWFQTPGARIGTTVAAVAILAAIGMRTWHQQAVWRDSLSLFTHAVTTGKDNGMAEDFLASALYAAGRFDEAAIHAGRACVLNPRSDTARINLASIRERQGRVPEAAALYRDALALRPDNTTVQMQLGLLELIQGHVEEARRLMTAALRATPALRERTLQLGHAALDQRDASMARFLFELVAAVLPDDAEARVALGHVLIQTGDRAAGLAEWRRALDLDPDYPGLREEMLKASREP